MTRIKILRCHGVQPPLQGMTREELAQYARRGRAEDLAAARESLRRHHLRMEELGYEQRPANVVPFRRSIPKHGGAA